MTMSRSKRDSHANIRIDVLAVLISFLYVNSCNKCRTEAFTTSSLIPKCYTPTIDSHTNIFATKRSLQLEIKSPASKSKRSTTSKIKSPTGTSKKTLSMKRRKNTSKNFSNTLSSKFLTSAMLDHEILTRKEELNLGEKITKARKLSNEISKYVIEISIQNCSNDKRTNLLLEDDNNSGVDHFNVDGNSNFFSDFNAEQLEIVTEDDSKLDKSILSIHFDPRLYNDIEMLTQIDIVQGLSLPGGKAELIQILNDGINARRKLISCNIKLVTSIAYFWMRRAISSSSFTKSSTDSGMTNSQLAQIYNVGTWDLPCLDDVINEGIIGLSKAADKYEAKRGNKFSTYATYWITSYIRQCFRDASTGSLHVPSALHEIKANHGKIVNRCYELNIPIPPEEEIAKELGVNAKRLRTALESTRSLVSLDAPLFNGKKNGVKGSGAGGDTSDNQVRMVDNLSCPEPKPEDFVELSILRQCLENAMASELSPHERDIIRLRLGLDDGKSRSVREVVEVCGGAVSMSEVRSAERRAFKKLSSPNTMHAHNLIAFLDQTEVDLYTTKSWVR